MRSRSGPRVRAVALTAGPFVGGALITLVGWRAIFLVNLPIGLAGLWLTWRYAERDDAVDAPASSTCRASSPRSARSARSQARSSRGGALGWTPSGGARGFALAAIVLAVLFIWREQRAAQPMLPLSLFRNRLFAMTSLDRPAAVNVAIYGLIFVLEPVLPAGQRPVGLVDRARLRADDGGGAAGQFAGAACVRAHRCLQHHDRRRLRLGARMSRPARRRARAPVTRAIFAQMIAISAGLGLLVPPLTSTLLRQRGEGALRHRRRRTQRHAADRQRARRRAVRLADAADRRIRAGPAHLARDRRPSCCCCRRERPRAGKSGLAYSEQTLESANPRGS